MSNIDKQAYRADGGDIGTGRIKDIAHNPYGDEEKCWLAKRVLALLDELEAKDKRIDEQREVMRQAASDISYAIFNLTGSDLSRLQPGVVETTDPTDTALIAERSLRAAAAAKGE